MGKVRAYGKGHRRGETISAPRFSSPRYDDAVFALQRCRIPDRRIAQLNPQGRCERKCECTRKGAPCRASIEHRRQRTMHTHTGASTSPSGTSPCGRTRRNRPTRSIDPLQCAILRADRRPVGCKCGTHEPRLNADVAKWQGCAETCSAWPKRLSTFQSRSIAYPSMSKCFPLAGSG